ncbi:MAG: peptide MFS transporter [Planctomycetota bacterium]
MTTSTDRLRHPRGLPVLFFTEMWERFGYYLMLGILVLYMIDPLEAGPFGGLGFDKAWAGEIYGSYLAMVYVMPFFGGILADNFLGYRKSIVIGGSLMALGYLGVGVPILPGMDWIPRLPSFYISLLVICIGNGFFKPNMSALVGRLYADDSPLKESGYNIFYMGINIGAFICNFVAAWLRNQYGWGFAFCAAGLGMVVGVIWFLSGQKHLAGTPDRGAAGSAAKDGGTVMLNLLLQVLLPAAACGTLGYNFLANVFHNAMTAAFVCATIPIIIYYVLLWKRAAPDEKGPIGALLSVFAVVVVFWMIFHQNGSSQTIWAEENTWREAGAATPVVEGLHFSQDATIGTAIEDPDAKDSYWHNVPAAERPAEGEKVALISTEMFQSINPFFIVVLTPLVVWFFSLLRRRNKEPSTPAKIAWGMFITALSTLPMIIAVVLTHGGAGKTSAMWLVASYGIITVGELCLSPMGLALVSKLSPPRVTALMMGGWFLATAIGNKLAGVLASFWESIPLVWIFTINCIAAIFAAIVIAMLTPWIRGVMKQHMGKS